MHNITTQANDLNTSIADALADAGWIVIPNYLSAAELLALQQLAQQRRECFVAAGVGREAAHQVRQDIRGDAVLWIENDDAEMAAANQRMSELQHHLNRELYLGLAELEWHFARYPVGSFYQRHLDQHRNQDTRVVTVVQYLNDNWTDADGGQLRIYLDDENHIDVTPHGGTLVVFLSNRFEHEVLPAQRERLSLTGWYRRRAN
ncbi:MULTISPECIES: 2OG-Fe(II) oxygenase [Deefgea]|uniref:2OG-Fe(II) oxygenase n=1 Tax=Deefgea chitinilytica TaxID=570276 RepID=A0ABS2CEG2_9NEIS|nr:MULTISPECIES: 2OG-Fe(II) oxygenase [Deefgea]MBM5572539.1 2OG-Fe(II) oxygenase [Deefgea chitinilytica]MBM9889775.1 2OG-Fe(II) oxygenase [Deefgea sp. CFH1-16]